jgi:hypothetical protein
MKASGKLYRRRKEDKKIQRRSLNLPRKTVSQIL